MIFMVYNITIVNQFGFKMSKNNEEHFNIYHLDLYENILLEFNALKDSRPKVKDSDVESLLDYGNKRAQFFNKIVQLQKDLKAHQSEVSYNLILLTRTALAAFYNFFLIIGNGFITLLNAIAGAGFKEHQYYTMFPDKILAGIQTFFCPDTVGTDLKDDFDDFSTKTLRQISILNQNLAIYNKDDFISRFDLKKESDLNIDDVNKILQNNLNMPESNKGNLVKLVNCLFNNLKANQKAANLLEINEQSPLELLKYELAKYPININNRDDNIQKRYTAIEDFLIKNPNFSGMLPSEGGIFLKADNDYLKDFKDALAKIDSNAWETFSSNISNKNSSYKYAFSLLSNLYHQISNTISSYDAELLLDLIFSHQSFDKHFFDVIAAKIRNLDGIDNGRKEMLQFVVNELKETLQLNSELKIESKNKQDFQNVFKAIMTKNLDDRALESLNNLRPKNSEFVENVIKLFPNQLEENETKKHSSRR